jgi:hypothetical protein
MVAVAHCLPVHCMQYSMTCIVQCSLSVMSAEAAGVVHCTHLDTQTCLTEPRLVPDSACINHCSLSLSAGLSHSLKLSMFFSLAGCSPTRLRLESTSATRPDVPPVRNTHATACAVAGSCAFQTHCQTGAGNLPPEGATESISSSMVPILIM